MLQKRGVCSGEFRVLRFADQKRDIFLKKKSGNSSMSLSVEVSSGKEHTIFSLALFKSFSYCYC